MTKINIGNFSAHRSHLRRREDMTILVRNFSQCLARQQHESSMLDTVQMNCIIFNRHLYSQTKLSIPSHSSTTPFGVPSTFAEERNDDTLTQHTDVTLRLGHDSEGHSDDDDMSGEMYSGSDEFKRLEKVCWVEIFGMFIFQ
jgi:hypothetical protein